MSIFCNTHSTHRLNQLTARHCMCSCTSVWTVDLNFKGQSDAGTVKFLMEIWTVLFDMFLNQIHLALQDFRASIQSVLNDLLFKELHVVFLNDDDDDDEDFTYLVQREGCHSLREGRCAFRWEVTADRRWTGWSVHMHMTCLISLMSLVRYVLKTQHTQRFHSFSRPWKMTFLNWWLFHDCKRSVFKWSKNKILIQGELYSFFQNFQERLTAFLRHGTQQWMTWWQRTWGAVGCQLQLKQLRLKLCCFSGRTSSLSSCVFEFFSVWRRFISAVLLSADCFVLSNLQMIGAKPQSLFFMFHQPFILLSSLIKCRLLDTFIQKGHTINVSH